MTRRYRYRCLRVVAFVALALSLGACNPGPEPVDQARATDITAPTVAATVVVAEPAIRRTLHDEIVLSAQATPWAAVTVTAEIPGRVVEVAVEVGDRVTAGATLVRLDEIEMTAQLAQATARLEGARAALGQAKLDLERGQRLAASKDISEGEHDRLRLAARTGQALASEAEAVVTLARKRLTDCLITAPFGGVISERSVELGSWVSLGLPVVRVVDQQRIKMRAAASQRDRARLRVGLRVGVRVHALPEATFVGQVRLLGTESDAATGSYLVEAAVNRAQTSGALLLPGMEGTINVILEEFDALVVPRQALIDDQEGAMVYIVEQGHARQLRPRLGRLTAELAEVVEGLEAGDTVIVQGQHQLADGDLVEVHDS